MEQRSKCLSLFGLSIDSRNLTVILHCNPLLYIDVMIVIIIFVDLLHIIYDFCCQLYSCRQYLVFFKAWMSCMIIIGTIRTPKSISTCGFCSFSEVLCTTFCPSGAWLLSIVNCVNFSISCDDSQGKIRMPNIFFKCFCILLLHKQSVC